MPPMSNSGAASQCVFFRVKESVHMVLHPMFRDRSKVEQDPEKVGPGLGQCGANWAPKTA